MFSPQSSLLLSSPRATKVQIHWVLQVAAMLCTSVGFGVILYNKNLHGKDHFTSWHGCFGLVTMIFVFFQAIQGLTVLYPQLKFYKAKMSENKQLHALLGTFVFTLASTTIILGLFSNWFVKNTNEAVWWGSALSTMSLTGIIIGQVTKEYMARNKPATK